MLILVFAMTCPTTTHFFYLTEVFPNCNQPYIHCVPVERITVPSNQQKDPRMSGTDGLYSYDVQYDQWRSYGMEGGGKTVPRFCSIPVLAVSIPGFLMRGLSSGMELKPRAGNISGAFERGVSTLQLPLLGATLLPTQTSKPLSNITRK
jgi:hypothetical protein